MTCLTPDVTLRRRESIVRNLAADPDGWNAETNRMAAGMCASLLSEGVDPQVLYTALLAGERAVERSTI
jgi:hypothetical protein